MNKNKVPLGCLIQSKVNVEAFYSNYGLTPPIWVPANTWLRVGAIDVTPVRGSRAYVCVDFFVEGYQKPITTYMQGLKDYPVVTMRPVECRAAIHYDEIAKVWNDGPRFLTTIPHYWSEREAMGLVLPENQEKLQKMKDEFWTIKRFDDAKMHGYYMGKL